LAGRAITAVNMATFAGAGVAQALSGVVVDAFVPAPATPAPPEAYRALFLILAVVLLAGVALYVRVADLPPSRSRGISATEP
jgi:hypothetical protein